METSQKMRRGFLKSKLAMSLCRVAKPKPMSPNPSPSPSPTSPAGASVRFFNGHTAVAPNQKVYAAKAEVVESLVRGGDENVDAKAAGYISQVRERFKLERVDSERRRYQEMGY